MAQVKHNEMSFSDYFIANYEKRFFHELTSFIFIASTYHSNSFESKSQVRSHTHSNKNTKAKGKELEKLISHEIGIKTQSSASQRELKLVNVDFFGAQEPRNRKPSGGNIKPVPSALERLAKKAEERSSSSPIQVQAGIFLNRNYY